MSETNEPSYYEIALTNRQVLVSFVVLLTCVLAAFLSGVWVGRNGSSPMPAGDRQLAAVETTPTDLAELEEFKFFSDQEENAAAADSERREVVTDPESSSTLVEDVRRGSASRSEPPPPAARARTEPPPAAAPPPRAAPPPPLGEPTVASRPAPTPAATGEGLVIQVLSTRDEARANRILNQLKQGGYPAFLSPVQVGTQVNYRVRVGPYRDRPPAEQAADEVNRKYKLDTWITAASN